MGNERFLFLLCVEVIRFQVRTVAALPPVRQHGRC